MAENSFRVTLYRVGEGEHQASEVTVQALALRVDGEGVRIDLDTGGSHHYAVSHWGRIDVVRVEDR